MFKNSNFQNQSTSSNTSDPVVGATAKDTPAAPPAGATEETRERRHTGGNQSGAAQDKHGPPPASPPPPIPDSQSHDRKPHKTIKGLFIIYSLNEESATILNRFGKSENCKTCTICKPFL